MKIVEVTAAIMKNDKMQYLIAQRDFGKDLQLKWEFPGGKIEPNESPEECLKRELWEEFSIEARIGSFFAKNDHPHGGKIIRLLAYEAEHISGEFVLRDHNQIKWVGIQEIAGFDFAPADVPIVEKLVKI